MPGESLLDAAILLATKAHHAQRDKGGHPYILHPLRVMFAVETVDEKIVAVLHDVAEDNPRYHPAQNLILPSNIKAALDALTRRDGETYDDYVTRIIVAGPLAMKVKLADLQDNMDLSRLAEMTAKDVTRQLKYARACARLKIALQGAQHGDN